MPRAEQRFAAEWRHLRGLPSYAFFVTAVLLVPVGGARADSADTLNVQVSETMLSDDNLFRLPTGADPSAQIGNAQRSDRITVDALAFSLNKPYSLQQFHVDASYVKYRYNTYHFLDFAARNGAAYWNWALTPRLTGKLSFDQQQSLNSFADFTNINVRNVKTTTNRNADLDYWFHGGWHFTAGGFRNKTTNTVVYLQGGDLDNRGGQAGVRYLTADGDYIAYQGRYSSGLYPDTTAISLSLYTPAFRQVDREMLWRWTLSGHSQLQGRVTQFERKHSDFPVRDYQGTAGRVAYTWTPTGKTQLLVSGARDYGSYLASNANYYVTDTLSVAPSWQVSAKTLVRLKFDHIKRDYLGDPGLGLAALNRADRQRSSQLSLDWAPTKALSFSVALQRDLRRSTAAGLDYDDTTASISATFSF